MNYFILLLPVIVGALAYKWPRIALLFLLLSLQMWSGAVLVILVTVIAKVRFRVHKMTEEEYQEFKNNNENFK